MSRGSGHQTKDASNVDLVVTPVRVITALALGGLLINALDLLGRRVDVLMEASHYPALR